MTFGVRMVSSRWSSASSSARIPGNAPPGSVEVGWDDELHVGRRVRVLIGEGVTEPPAVTRVVDERRVAVH